MLCDENYVCEVMTKEAGDVTAGDVTAVAMCVCPPGFREERKAGFKACRPGEPSGLGGKGSDDRWELDWEAHRESSLRASILQIGA